MPRQNRSVKQRVVSKGERVFPIELGQPLGGGFFVPAKPFGLAVVYLHRNTDDLKLVSAHILLSGQLAKAEVLRVESFKVKGDKVHQM